ncbi:hypothetical protein [Nitrosomonas sp. wSCUT-2]
MRQIVALNIAALLLESRLDADLQSLNRLAFEGATICRIVIAMIQKYDRIRKTMNECPI